MEINFKAGDIIRVHQKIYESEKVKGASKSKHDVTEELKERIQVFEGVVLAVQSNKSFTVRKISAAGVGVERTWPINCPSIVKIEVKKKAKKGQYRRSKLYYLKNRDLKQSSK